LSRTRTRVQHLAQGRFRSRARAWSASRLRAPGLAPALPTGLVAFPRWSTVCAGNPSSTGREATLHASGLTSLSSRRLRLGVVDVPPGELSAMFIGANAAPTPLFGGVPCVGGASILVGISRADAQGRTSVPVSLQGAGHQPGDVVHAQCLYRDSQTPGGSGANLSSSITFTLSP